MPWALSFARAQGLVKSATGNKERDGAGSDRCRFSGIDACWTASSARPAVSQASRAHHRNLARVLLSTSRRERHRQPTRATDECLRTQAEGSLPPRQ